MPERRAGLVRATLTLLAGGVVAQALPLLLGPWLTRLYAPDEFGHYTLFVAITANLATVACARYEYALPLAHDDAEARDLMALCLRMLLGVTAFSVVVAVTLGALDVLDQWALLPWAVVAAGAAQWLTLWATRSQRFSALSASRITQYGGAALVQVAGGIAKLGTTGLVLGPVVASAVALAWLRSPAPLGGWRGLWRVPKRAWRAAAVRHREFPLFNTPHAFLGALQDTLTVALLVAWTGDAAAGFWGLALRYLKAPATLIGGAVSQALYPRLAHATPLQARAAVRQVMGTLAALAVPLVLVLLLAGPDLFAFAFGERWRPAGELSRALAPYIGVHFVASPLAVATLAWHAQAWALRVAIAGQIMFLAALVVGLHFGCLTCGAWAGSAAMVCYFGWFFIELPHRCPEPDMQANHS